MSTFTFVIHVEDTGNQDQKYFLLRINRCPVRMSNIKIQKYENFNTKILIEVKLSIIILNFNNLLNQKKLSSKTYFLLK